MFLNATYPFSGTIRAFELATSVVFHYENMNATVKTNLKNSSKIFLDPGLVSYFYSFHLYSHFIKNYFKIKVIIVFLLSVQKFDT